MKNLMQKIKEAKSAINQNYCMTVPDMFDILNNSSEDFDLVSNSFVFGYMQGVKAAKAEMRKKKGTKS